MNVDTLYQLVGERIRNARNLAGLSQAALAKKLDMSRTSVVNIEAGRQKPPLHIIWQIAEEVGTEAALLIPNQTEYQNQEQPFMLSEEEIAQIETEANGDPAARRDLTNFIGRIKSRSSRNS